MKEKIKELLHKIRSGHVIRNLKISKWLGSKGTKFLQIGCGPHRIKRAMNADIKYGDIYIDATKELPLPKHSIDYIFTEQFIEHLEFKDGKSFVREAFRVLKPGGVIRQATPSLQGLIDVYEDENEHVNWEDAIQRHISNHRPIVTGRKPANFVNDFFRLWGHRFIYDKETLKNIHIDAGFRNVEWKEFGKSSYDILKNRERHADTDWMKRAFVIICEASKG